MRMLRSSMILAVTLAFLAVEPKCFANKKAYIPFFTPPVQNYAVIDISGNSTTVQNGDGTTTTHPVDLIALNDSNQAAFGFFTGNIVNVCYEYDQYQIRTWSAGNLQSRPTMEIVRHINTDPSGGDHWDVTEISGLTPSGSLYGDTRRWGSANGASYGETVSYTFGCSEPPDPPFHIDPDDSLEENGVGSVSNNGFASGLGACSMGYYAFIVSPDNQFKLFPFPYSHINGPFPGNVQVINEDFSPIQVNNKGQATGGDFEDSDSIYFWDGSNTTSIGLGQCCGLNDQGQVIMQDYDTFDGLYSSGYLWEQYWDPTVLWDELPVLIGCQYLGIQPTSISNQVKAAPAPPLPADPTTDATIHILADAEGDDVGLYGKMVWTRDNNDKWTFANIALPEGTSIDTWTSINSSGVIAAIGNGGHALLLVPMYVTTDTNNNYQVDLGSQGGTSVQGNNTSGANTNDTPQVNGPDKQLTYLKFGLWDHAFASGALRNDNAEAGNFIGCDSQMFYFSVRLGGIVQGPTITIHWYTDSDHPSIDTITLTKSATDPTLYSSKALMLVADDVDNNVEANTGLPGGGNAKYGEADHRLRKATLSDKVYFSINSNGSGTASTVFPPLPIFNPKAKHGERDAIEHLDVQIVNTTALKSTGPVAVPTDRNTFIATQIKNLKARYAVVGVNVNAMYDPSVDVLAIPPDKVDLTNFAENGGDGASSSSINPTVSSDEAYVINLLHNKYDTRNAGKSVLYMIVIGAFRDLDERGESFPAAILNAHPSYRNVPANCSFVSQNQSHRSSGTFAHEIGHMLLNRIPQDIVWLEDPLDFDSKGNHIETIGHYVGNEENYNLMRAHAQMLDQVVDAKRLWNDANHFDGVHSGSLAQPIKPFQVDYLRMSPLLQ